MLTRCSAAELHETPNARMHRYPGAAVAVWRTEMPVAASGPLHTIDREQTVVVIDGELEVTIDGAAHVARPGDSVTIPARALRRLANPGASTLVTVTAAVPGGVACVPDGDEVRVPWAQ